MKIEIKNDKYRKSRGGYSKILNILCESCDKHLLYYQKDGPGILKRLYFDRITGYPDQKNLVCRSCKDILGVSYIYPKEKRQAYRLFAGEVSKRIIKNR